MYNPSMIINKPENEPEELELDLGLATQTKTQYLKPKELLDATKNIALISDGLMAHFTAIMTDDKIILTISDGFIAISHSVKIHNPNQNNGFGETFQFSITQIKALVEFLSNVKDLKTQPGSISLEQDDGCMIFKDDATGAQFQLDECVGNAYDHKLMKILDVEWETYPYEIKPFSIHPMRLQSIGRLKGPDKGISLDLRFVTHNERDYCVIKYGPSIRLTIAGIDRKTSGTYIETLEIERSECQWS